MNLLIRTLYQYKVIPIRMKDLVRWWDQKEVEMLIMATEIGTSKIRISALDKLRTLPSYSSLIKNQLIRVLYSDNIVVGNKALEILHNNYMPRELEDEESYHHALEYFEESKRIKEDIASYYQESAGTISPLRSSKSDMKMLNMVKKALKKPIR